MCISFRAGLSVEPDRLAILVCETHIAIRVPSGRIHHAKHVSISGRPRLLPHTSLSGISCPCHPVVTHSSGTLRADGGSAWCRIVNEDRCGPRQHIVCVQARPLLLASFLAIGRFDSRRMFELMRWSLLALPSLLPSAVYTA